MSRPGAAVAIAGTLMLTSTGATLGQEASPTASPSTQDVAFDFVVSGTSGSMDEGTLTLEGVTGILAFSDRPERIVRSLPVEAVGLASEALAGDPPNAVLSVLGIDAVTNVVLELTSATVDGGSVIVDYDLLAGAPLAGAFGPASLFIDGVIYDIPQNGDPLIDPD